MSRPSDNVNQCSSVHDFFTNMGVETCPSCRIFKYFDIKYKAPASWAILKYSDENQGMYFV